MKNALSVLRGEHRLLAAVRHGLRMLTRDAQDTSVKPDFAVFQAMIRYIDDFPERLHHPKEDTFLFPRVAARSPDAVPLIEVLRAEHVQGARLIRDLENSLAWCKNHWPGGAERFAALVESYSQFHWEHMRKEEDQLLPLAERVLTAEDWRGSQEAFAGNADPIADLREKDFTALFTRIVNLAPAPIGLGDRWEKSP